MMIRRSQIATTAWILLLVSATATLAADDSRVDLAGQARIVAHSRITDEQADVNRMTDGDPDTWWSSGPGDLALHPLDVDLFFEQPHVVNGLLVVTSTLKGQLRLKDFDLFAGLEGEWDGARPLARARDNSDKVIRVPFPAARIDRLRLRLLGSRRPDNAFAHIAELTICAAEDKPQRKVEPSPFPATAADAGHDPKKLRALITTLNADNAPSRLAEKRLHSLQNRLQLIEESQQYMVTLAKITAETAQFRNAGAPQWAVAQRDCMARLRTWAHYWIDHQQPDGQFGGGYEDDVELVCGWPVLVLAQDDDRVRQSLTRLAEGVWKSRPFLERFGYDRLTDVEHAAENTSYSQPRMVVMDYSDPQWAERCRRTTVTMSDNFLSRNQQGHLQFRSDFFGFDPRTLRPVTREEERPFDIPESAKALKPSMYAVWATNDPQARQIMLDSGRTWCEAARSSDGPDRIAGLLPEKIRWPSGQAMGTHARMSSMRATLFHLIGCYYVSDDDRYLEPIRSLLEKTLLEWSVKGVPSAGSLQEVRPEDHAGLLEQLALVAILYRRATGDTRFDASLEHWARRIRSTLVEGVKSYILVNRNSQTLWLVDRPLTVGAYLESRCAVGSQLYLGWQVTGDDDYLARLGWNLSSCLNDKWGSLTYWFYDKSEPRVTSNDHLAHKIQSSEAALCLMYLGGPACVEAVWPQLAVSWKHGGENFCALVRDNSTRELRVHLYGFDTEPRSVTAHLWELAPGDYEAVLGPDADQDGFPDDATWRMPIEIQSRAGARHPAPLRFTLPSRRLSVLQIQRQR